MDRQEANKQLQVEIQAAYDALDRAKRLANEFNLTFTFQPTYGMGGTYYGRGRWNDSGCSDEDTWDDSGCSEDRGEWVSSSQDC